MALEQYAGTVLPIASGWGTQTGSQTVPQGNPITMAAGGAMSGAAMGSMFGMGPMGAMIGGGMGLLGGLL